MISIQEIIKDLNFEIKRKNKEYQNSLEIGINYNLELYYNEGSKKLFEEIQLEGYKNAILILEQYRKIGFIINLKKLVLTLNDKKIKGITFKN